MLLKGFVDYEFCDKLYSSHKMDLKNIMFYKH